MVSIHAPGRGATTLANNKTDALVVSIHAPGRGATVAAISASFLRPMFQFTHPGGVRRIRSLIYTEQRLCFNSRTREGCDKRLKATTTVCPKVSIHAPGRGATLPSLTSRLSVVVSIHAPGRGATRQYRPLGGYTSAFQFTHPGGGRLDNQFLRGFFLQFQFTHPGGVRPNTSSRRTAPAVFQFTHPGGVRLKYPFLFSI